MRARAPSTSARRRNGDPARGCPGRRQPQRHHPASAAPGRSSRSPGCRSKHRRPRQKPDQVLADRGYDFDTHRRLLRVGGIKPVIARRGSRHGSGLGRHGWSSNAASRPYTTSAASGCATSARPHYTRATRPRLLNALRATSQLIMKAPVSRSDSPRAVSRRCALTWVCPLPHPVFVFHAGGSEAAAGKGRSRG